MKNIGSNFIIFKLVWSTWIVSMNRTIYSIDEIKKIIEPIAIKYDVDSIFLFGSYARGEASSSSDIDFIIEKGRLRGLQLAGMLCDLQELFNKEVDLLTFSGINNSKDNYCFKRNVEKEMIIVYGQ